MEPYLLAMKIVWLLADLVRAIQPRSYRMSARARSGFLSVAVMHVSQAAPPKIAPPDVLADHWMLQATVAPVLHSVSGSADARVVVHSLRQWLAQGRPECTACN